MTRHALIIGIAEYSSFARLDKATGDAEAVAQILEKYGNFDTIQRLPEGWNAAEARYYVAPDKLTGSKLGEALKTFLFDRAVGQDALIYFTGHGFKTVDILGKENGYLATSDCLLETNNAGQVAGQRYGVSLDSLNDLLVEARLSSLLVLLDCCHSGYLIEARLMDEKLSVFKKTRNACLIGSSQSFELSYVGREHSVFTGALLEALSPESAARDGTINSLNLFDKIESQLRRSGQQPIFMGYGNSIAVISYPPMLPVAVETKVNSENPYVGLDAFDGQSAQYFFGRDKAIQELQFRLRQGRFLCIIGASGAGKSSLVKAGLLPMLEKQYAIASLTPGTNPPNILIDRLTALQSQNRPFILFIDQFEEVFTLCKDDELRKSFFHPIAEVVKNSERQGQIIMAIRGDFLDRCAEYPEIAALVNETQPTTYMVEPLSLEELYDAIAQPAKLHGVSFQGGLVERMAREVAAQPGALPLLQYALRELWRVGIEEMDANAAALTWDNYNQIGGVGGALDLKADLIYRSFPEAGERDLIRRLCLELVELSEGDTVTRRRVTKESLAAEADSPEQFDRVLDSLVQNRLVAMTLHKIGEENYEPCVEVTHEALLSNWGTLRDWISQNRDNLRRKRRFEGYFSTWSNAGKSEEALLSGLWLSDAEGLREQGERLSAEEGEFIERSIGRRDREVQEKLDNERRLRQAAEDNAEAERKLKLEAQKLAETESERAKEAEAKVKIQKQRTRFAGLAGFLALLAMWLGLITQQYTQQQLQKARDLIEEADRSLKRHEQLEALIKSVEALKILKKLSINDNSYVQKVKEVVDGVRERNRLGKHQSSIETLAFNPNGQSLVSGDVDGRIIIWEFQANRILAKQLERRHTGPLWIIRFSPDGKLFASGGADGKVNIWNDKGEFQRNLPQEPTIITDLSFSNDGKIASATLEGKISIWNSQNANRLDSWQAVSAAAIKRPGIKIDFDPLDSSVIISNSHSGANFSIWDLRRINRKDIKQNIIGTNPSLTTLLRFSSDGKLILSLDKKSTISLWDRQGNFIQEIQNPKKVVAAAFNQSNDYIGIAKEDETIEILKVERVTPGGNSFLRNRSLRPVAEFGNHKGDLENISFGREGIIASASSDRIVRIWDFKNDLYRPAQNFNNLDDLLKHNCDILRVYFNTNSENDSQNSQICNTL